MNRLNASKILKKMKCFEGTTLGRNAFRSQINKKYTNMYTAVE